MTLEERSRQWDASIRDLVVALNEAGLQTDWCCGGNAEIHMSIRPIIQIRTMGTLDPHYSTILRHEYSIICDVLDAFEIGNAWVMLNFARGAYNTHGGEPTWIIQIPGRYDLTTALPVAYSKIYQTDQDRDPEWQNPTYRRVVKAFDGVPAAEWIKGQGPSKALRHED